MHYPYINQVRQDFSRTMTLRGEGSIEAVPDTVKIQMEVMTEDDQVSNAQQENAVIMRRVMDALTEAGIAPEDIQTTAYMIQPMYDYIQGQQVFRAYRVTNAVTVLVREMEQAGTIIDLAVEQGVNRITNVHLLLENPEDYYRQALSNALQDAVTKAELLAGKLRVTVDMTPVNIVEDRTGAARTFQPAILGDISGGTPVVAGSLSIEAAVEAKFRY